MAARPATQELAARAGVQSLERGFGILETMADRRRG